MRWIQRALLIVSFLSLCFGPFGCGGEDDMVDGRSLSVRLAEAQAGDVITLQGGTYTGSFLIPSGVTLDGGGATFVGDGRAVFILEPGAGVTTLRGLAIENAGVGVMTRSVGAGEVRLEDVSVRVTQGAGILLEGVREVALTDVVLVGSLEEDHLNVLGAWADAREHTVVGLVLARVESATLARVHISRFAGFAAAFYEVKAAWIGGVVKENAAFNVFAERAQVTLTDVQVQDGWKGQQVGAIPAMGLVGVDGSTLVTQGVSIQRMDGLGIFQDRSTGSHRGLTVEDSDDIGVMVQNTAVEGVRALEIMGDPSAIRRNRGCGVAVVDASRVCLEDVEVSSTNMLPVITNLGTMDVGDGVQLVRVRDEITMRDLVIEDNARIGLLIQGGGDAQGPTEFGFDQVQVRESAPGEGFGVAIQEMTRPTEADAITVAPTLAARDATLTGLLPVVSSAAQSPPTLGLSAQGIVGAGRLVAEDGTLGTPAQVGSQGLIFTTP